jgi:hypothetical protein
VTILAKFLSILLGAISAVLLLASFSLTVFPWGYVHLVVLVLAVYYLVIVVRSGGSIFTDFGVGVGLAGISALATLPQLRTVSMQLSPSIFLFSVIAVGLSASFVLWRISK